MLKGATMSEWQDLQKKPNANVQDFFKNHKSKTRNLNELSKTEQKRLVKLNGLLDQLTRRKNVQNR